jgi:Macrocin-O-methyltransferase (TylF)
LPDLLQSVAKRLLAKFGIGIFRIRGRYDEDGLQTVHTGRFSADSAFAAAYARGVRASNGVDPGFRWRVHVALWAARTSLRVGGDFVECGVNTGFISSAIMHNLRWESLERKFYLIDTFAGPVLTQYSEMEVETQRLAIAKQALDAGAYITDMERVRANFAEWSNAVIVRGSVPEILGSLRLGAIAFLHIDMNCAFPESAALEFFWNHMSPGAMILLDDYAYFGHDCQRAAIDQFASGVGTDILALPTGQGLIVR